MISTTGRFIVEHMTVLNANVGIQIAASSIKSGTELFKYVSQGTPPSKVVNLPMLSDINPFARVPKRADIPL